MQFYIPSVIWGNLQAYALPTARVVNDVSKFPIFRPNTCPEANGIYDHKKKIFEIKKTDREFEVT